MIMKSKITSIIKNILFAGLCIAIFMIFALSGVVLASARLMDTRYEYLKVSFTEDVGTVIQDQPYGDAPQQTYDLYLPADRSKQNYSLILYVHGGGFTGGDKAGTDAVRYGEYLASKGYVVASANYRLATEDNGVYVLDMYEDLMTATDAIVKTADKLGYHINEMATTGGSAGGCLAMLVAFKEPDRLPVPIRFVFEETGPASFVPELWGNETDDQKRFFVYAVTGKEFSVSEVGNSDYQAAIDEISVSTMINENSVPILLAYGPKDKIVNPNVKYPLLEALQNYGVEYTYIEFPNSGHGLANDPDKTSEWFDTMEEYLTKFFENNLLTD
jgi:acetyl esterase/lipase